ncbi:hypothetical protein HDU97_001269 [Phlyctochytrium planicorne]|nr:hypothetical protein HDU97_001269 [Phlyctochytrium planicorne]
MFYLTKDYLPIFIPLGFIGIYRWFWYIVKLMAFCLYKPIKPRRRPRFNPSRDVTILVPTIDSGEEIKAAIRTWLANKPFEIIFITTEKARADLEKLAEEVNPDRDIVRVITISKPNKRNQMTAGINHVKTELTVFCDDDVLWPDTMLKYMLAPFEDRAMGGVGTSQVAIPLGKRMTIWEILAAFRLSMRNVEITASTYIDGGVCCLSGRTATYRTSILRDPNFQWEFTHEFWRKKYHQHSGDDKFLTRWMHSHGWKTYIQCCPEAELQSTFKDNWRFLKQLLRWTRNTWRSDIRSLFFERQIWKRHPFVAFSMLDKFFNPLTLLAGPVTVVYLSTMKEGKLPAWLVIVSYIAWLLITRLIKYSPHFVRRPQDIFCIPAWLIFNIVFAIMKVYCLFTLHVTDWGTRTGADDHKEKEDLSIYEPHWLDGMEYDDEYDEEEYEYDEDEKGESKPLPVTETPNPRRLSTSNRRRSQKSKSMIITREYLTGLRSGDSTPKMSLDIRRSKDDYTRISIERDLIEPPPMPQRRTIGSMPSGEGAGGRLRTFLDPSRSVVAPSPNPRATSSVDAVRSLSMHMEHGPRPSFSIGESREFSFSDSPMPPVRQSNGGVSMERSFTAPDVSRSSQDIEAGRRSMAVEEGERHGVSMGRRASTLMAWATRRSRPDLSTEEEVAGRGAASAAEDEISPSKLKRKSSSLFGALLGNSVPEPVPELPTTIASKPASSQSRPAPKAPQQPIRHQPPPLDSNRVIKSAMRKPALLPEPAPSISNISVSSKATWFTGMLRGRGLLRPSTDIRQPMVPPFPDTPLHSATTSYTPPLTPQVPPTPQFRNEPLPHLQTHFTDVNKPTPPTPTSPPPALSSPSHSSNLPPQTPTPSEFLQSLSPIPHSTNPTLPELVIPRLGGIPGIIPSPVPFANAVASPNAGGTTTVKRVLLVPPEMPPRGFAEVPVQFDSLQRNGRKGKGLQPKKKKKREKVGEMDGKEVEVEENEKEKEGDGEKSGKDV